MNALLQRNKHSKKKRIVHIPTSFPLHIHTHAHAHTQPARTRMLIPLVAMENTCSIIISVYNKRTLLLLH